MVGYRVAVARTYKDVSVQYVQAGSMEEAKERAKVQARYDDAPTEFAEAVELDVIECDLEADL